MKPHIKNLFLFFALIAALALMPPSQVTAQTFTTLHNFTGQEDGAFPVGRLILSSNILYGMAENAGNAGGVGVVFAINADGTGFTNLHSLTFSDGTFPPGGLILSGNTLYGTTSGLTTYGGNGYGSVFKVSISGTGFTTLHSFSEIADSFPYGNMDGAGPRCGLILSAGILYGTAYDGGTSGRGAVFKVNTNGTGFTNLHSFENYISGVPNDGQNPAERLVLSGDTLYGTTRFGAADYGTVFKIDTDGKNFTNLHTFYGVTGKFPNELILSGDTLYGTTTQGGDFDTGSVFKMNTNGTGFMVLYSFTEIPFGPPFTNSDGAYPEAGLVLSGNTLYGIANGGGSSEFGTVFAVNTNGTGFTVLYTFTVPTGNYENSDGAFPFSELIRSGNTLYGTATRGGSSGNGTVFSLSFAPQLAIVRSGANVVLTWPTNFAGFDYTGFTLQSATNLTLPVIWSTNSPAPTIINGQNTVTNPLSVTQKFFRLKSP